MLAFAAYWSNKNRDFLKINKSFPVLWVFFFFTNMLHLTLRVELLILLPRCPEDNEMWYMLSHTLQWNRTETSRITLTSQASYHTVWPALLFSCVQLCLCRCVWMRADVSWSRIVVPPGGQRYTLQFELQDVTEQRGFLVQRSQHLSLCGLYRCTHQLQSTMQRVSDEMLIKAWKIFSIAFTGFLNLTSLCSCSSSGTFTSSTVTLNPSLRLFSCSSFCCKLAVSWACCCWCSHSFSSMPCNTDPPPPPQLSICYILDRNPDWEQLININIGYKWVSNLPYLC